MKINELIKTIEHDWGDRSSHVDYCIRLIDYINNNKYQDVNHLTYSSFKNILTPKLNTQVLFEILSYLSGDKVKVLEIHFELIDDLENCYVLSKEDVSDLINHGTLAHPRSGTLIPSAKDKVHVYYSPAESFVQNV